MSRFSKKIEKQIFSFEEKRIFNLLLKIKNNVNPLINRIYNLSYSEEELKEIKEKIFLSAYKKENLVGYKFSKKMYEKIKKECIYDIGFTVIEAEKK